MNLIHEFKHTKINIDVNCENDFDVNTFPGAISQVITNLLMNAKIHAFDGAMKDMLSGSRPATAQEEEYAKRLIQQTFRGFVSIVADGRKAFNGDENNVLQAEFADGRVVSGADALRLKLVDQLGYFADAVNKATALAGVTSPKIIRLHRSMSLADILFGAKADLKLNVVAPFAGPTVTINPGQAYYILPAYAP